MITWDKGRMKKVFSYNEENGEKIPFPQSTKNH